MAKTDLVSLRKFNEQLLFTRNLLFGPLYLNNFCQQLQKIKTTMAFVNTYWQYCSNYCNISI